MQGTSLGSLLISMWPSVENAGGGMGLDRNTCLLPAAVLAVLWTPAFLLMCTLESSRNGLSGGVSLPPTGSRSGLGSWLLPLVLRLQEFRK